ncbi:MAG: FG-GAP-like repeat-containing protein [Prolixibacteraceae bacterium]|jgi:endonuclease/exonuclease/phosphatase family metal-dependent hydrolase|nr:FG-GAP-like repeat-containing protein [Prolixibacteraceae bacterium]
MKKRKLNVKRMGFDFPQMISLKTIIALLTLLFFGCKQQLDPEEYSITNDVPLMLKVASVSNSIKVMSFNVRHHDDSDPQSLEERKDIIRQVILDNNPDIVGLQEYSDDWFQSWLTGQMTTAGYSAYQTTGEFGSPKVIFYKSSRFTRTDEGFFTMVYTENRSARWVILQDNVTDQEYFVLNTHWTTVSSAERQLNASDIIDGITENSQGLPLIIIGDLNAQPGTTEMTNLQEAKDLVCAHNETGETFHGWDATGEYKIDYILYSRNLSFIDSKVVNTSYSGNWPSDHWPITSTFIPAIFGGAHYDIHGISGVASTKFYFADVTGDGKDDKIFWRPNYDNGCPRIFESNGDGTFTYKLSHSASASTLSTTFYYFADVNGDGKADMIKWDRTQNSGKTLVYFATGNGNFSATPVSDISGTSESSSTTFYFADVDGDGNADKIYWNPTYDSGHTRIFLSDGDGNFTFADSNSTGYSESTSTTYYFADVNGDGKADKIYWNPTYDSGHTRVFLSNGDGTFTFADSNSNGYSVSTLTTFYFADIDGDGKKDKIYWNPENYLGKIKVYRALGDGSFDDPIYSLRGTSESSDTQYFFADINGDGQDDQIRWNYAQSPEGYSQGTLKNYFANDF